MPPLNRFHLIGVVFASLSAACGIEAPRIAEPELVVARKNPVNPDFSDHWQSICMRSKMLNASVQFEYEFHPSRYQERQIYYSDNDCRSESVVAYIQYEGSFRANVAVTPFQIDLEYEKAFVTAVSELGRRILSDYDFCGIQEWTIDRPEDVSTRQRGNQCPLKETPHTRPEIFRLVGPDRLEFGAGYIEDAAEEPRERPTQFATDSPFFRRKSSRSGMPQ